MKRFWKFRIWLLAISSWLPGARAESPAVTQADWLFHETIDHATLARDFAPKVQNPNKRLLLEIALPPETRHEGQITITRAKAMDPPRSFPASSPKISSVPGFFTYDTPAKRTTAWHVNFADPDLFAYYGRSAFAQDEIQVAEHPLLASVREMLLAKKHSALTVERNQPTPFLLTNVPRRLRFSTDPNPAAGRPAGLYGHRFGLASAEVVRKAATRLEPPTPSNILAMAAPSYGKGKYTAEELRHILSTAYTGFLAARTLSPKSDAVQIHTGFWGCGAFGGNRTVMLSLQMAAARLAEVDAVFHTADAPGEKDFAAAKAVYEEALKGNVADFLDHIEKKGYRWGQSDGN